MIRRIRSIGVWQAVKVCTVLYGIMGLLFAPIFLIIAMFSPDGGGMVAGIGMAIAMPIGYAVIGAITTAIMAVVYNVIAKMTGGFELEVEDAPV